MREHRFIKDTFINELVILRELETGLALHQIVKLVLAEPSSAEPDGRACGR